MGEEFYKTFHVNEFKCVDNLSEFNEDFIKSYNEKCNEGYFLDADIPYCKNLHDFHNDLPFQPEMKKIDQVKKLVHIRNLKQALNRGLVLKKFRKFNEFNQKTCLKSYIDKNTELKKKAILITIS